MLLRPMIASRAFNTPLLMHPSKASAILMGIGGRIVQGGVRIENSPSPVDHTAFENGRPSAGHLPNQIQRAFERSGDLPFAMVGGVGVIPVEGTLVQKGTFIGQDASGFTSYEGLQAQIRLAAGSNKVKAVVFEMDSFGGEVSGAFETAAMIRDLSLAKPTIAILTDFALSAGYMLASQARQIVAPQFGEAGSIGAIAMHVDFSANLDQEGINVTLLRAGERKAEANQFEPLPDSVAARIRADLEQIRQLFAQIVGMSRGGRFTAEQAMETEAAGINARDAARMGMIDAVGDPNETFEAFVREINGSN